ncbi:MAG: pilin [Patescibacteria group bacterium]
MRMSRSIPFLAVLILFGAAAWNVPVADALECNCSGGDHDTPTCIECESGCTAAGGTMTGFNGSGGSACNASGEAYTPAPGGPAPTCGCTTPPEPAGSAGDLDSCCTLCRDSHGGTVQTDVLYNGATEACTGVGAAPGALTPRTGDVVGEGGARGAAAPTLPNPLGGTTDIRSIIGRVISAALGISGSIALLMFVWGGLQWLTSGGSPERIKKGKDTIVWAVLGLVLIFGSYAILNFVLGAILSA